MNDKLQVLRLVHAALLLACVLYAGIGEFAGPKEPKDATLLLMVLGFLGVTDLGLAAFLRGRWVGAAEEALRRSPEDASALQRWMTGHFVVLALCEAVAIFGLVLRMLGGTLIQALPFYGASVLMILAWRPRRPE